MLRITREYLEDLLEAERRYANIVKAVTEFDAVFKWCPICGQPEDEEVKEHTNTCIIGLIIGGPD